MAYELVPYDKLKESFTRLGIVFSDAMHTDLQIAFENEDIRTGRSLSQLHVCLGHILPNKSFRLQCEPTYPSGPQITLEARERIIVLAKKIKVNTRKE